MSESLRDQLLKSGLAKSLKPEPKPAPKQGGQRPPSHHAQKPHGHKPHAQKPHGQKPHVQKSPAKSQEELDLARAYAIRAKVERDEREHAHREAERIAREKKERKAKLVALLDGKSLNVADADVPRHFPHGNKIRRIYVTAEQLTRLNQGELAVVQLAGRYLLVESGIAQQAKAIQEESLVLLCDPNASAEDDVPDDLVW